MKTLFGFVLLLGHLAFAEDVGEWVAATIKEQRGGEPKLPSSNALWSGSTQSLQKQLGKFVPPTSLAPLVRAVRSGVVNVSTTNEGPSHSLGSGFIINSNGLIVTNNHVVDRAQAIVVRLADGREFEARMVGRDPQTDLALMWLVGASNLPTVTLGDSDTLEVGDWVVAIGNPFGLDLSVTHGLISARERVIGMGPFDDFIQTNALINPGNSGGPLFDMKGDVVGVTTAIVSQGQGIGFAVPINLVKDLLPNLLENGRPERGWLGVNIQENDDPLNHFARVTEVYEGSPAVKSGIEVGDRLTSIGGKSVDRYQQILRRIALQGPGTTVKLGLLRGGKQLEVSATLAARPAATALKALVTGGRIDSMGLVVREGVDHGIRVEALIPGGAGELASMSVGDLIVEANREPVTTLKELQLAMAESAPGEPVLLKLRRGQVARYVALRPR
jgi:serine protease Do